MKLKLSKTSWLILAAGVFLVVLAGLGLTRSQQVKEQTKVTSDLDLATKKLSTVQIATLSQQLETLKTKVDENRTLLNNAQSHLHQTVISVDVSDQFFQIAAFCSVNVTTFTTTTIAQNKFDNVIFSTISLSATVQGQKMDIVKFITTLNNDYITGNVQSAQIAFDATSTSEVSLEGDTSVEGDFSDTTPDTALSPGTASATISMLIYSYEEQ
jgi:hypothetical protein